MPTLVNYQGQIQNPDGTAPPTADYTLTIRIYDSAVGGTLIWGPQIFDGQAGPGYGPKIPVVQGYFNVTLGTIDTNNRPLSAAFNGAIRYLETSVSNRPPILPRQQLLSTPFALRAGDSDRAVNAQLATNAIYAGLATSAINAGLATNSLNLGGTLATNVVLGLVPVGSILPFYGDLASLPSNWRYCDGSLVNDVSSPFNGSTVPDLTEKFIRGTGSSFDSALGSVNGSNYIYDHDHYFYHKHQVNINTDDSFYSGSSYNSVNLAGGGTFHVIAGKAVSDLDHVHNVSGYTFSTPLNFDNTSKPYTDPGGGHDNRPNYYSLHFIIRIR